MIAKPGKANPVEPSIQGKLTANIGENGTLTSAAASAFGFLPANTGTSVPPQVPAPGTTSVGTPVSPLKAASVQPAVSAPMATSAQPKAIALTATGLKIATVPTTTAVQPSPAASNTPSTAPATSPLAVSSTASGSPQPPVTLRALSLAAATPPPPDPPPNVVLDGTLGQTGQPVISANSNGVNDYAVDASLGKQVGGNLFFSFLQFSLATGESATFTGPGSVQNILTRVTGGSPSTIDGTINVSIPGANFYLMNPAGVVFTANASLNVAGSFTVTTADYLKLADGNRFTALPGPSDASLTAAAVSAFGFLPGKAAPPGPVMISGDPTVPTSLFVANGMNFAVVAGNQTIDGQTLRAPAGQLTLVSVAGPGEVPAVPSVLAATPLTALPALGTINIQDGAFISAGSSKTPESGHVEMDAGMVTVDNSIVDASMLEIPSGPAGGASSILVRCQTLLVSDNGQISAASAGFGGGGTVDIQAQDVTLANGSLIQTTTSGQSSGGSITVAANNLSIDGSTIETSANGSGAAGNIYVTANTVSIAGTPNSTASGILAESGSAGAAGNFATGRSGDIHVAAQQLTLTGGGEISATTFGPGQGGNVSVSASNISISGSSSFVLDTTTYVFQSGTLASSGLPGDQGTGGQGGDVTISTNSLNVSNNGLITASTIGSGGSGNVTINANSILLDGTGATLPTGIAATTAYQTGGKAGDINLAAGSLEVLGGAEISAATAGTGTGGNISVYGSSVLVSGATSIITAQTTGIQGGAGGSLRFNVNSVQVMDGGQISASTQGSGQGGSIAITANQVTVEGSSSSIVAETSGMNASVANDPNTNDISVTLAIQSTVDSRLAVFLTDPGGDQIALLNRGDATGRNLTGTTFSDSGATPISGGVAPYSGTFQPATPLAVFNSGAANGTWDLLVSNGGPGRNNATLEAALLTVNGQQLVGANLPESIGVRGSVDVLFAVTLPTTQTMVKAGVGGSILINAGTVSLSNGGTITASTHGDGAAGSLTVRANSITIDASHASSDTGFFASAEAGSTGRGGSISISTGEFQVIGASHPGIDGGVVARSTTAAPAGDVTLLATAVTLDSNAVISSANTGSGTAGSVFITSSGPVTLDGGSTISTAAAAGQAGDITVATGSDLRLTNGSGITASAGTGGGNITMTIQGTFYLQDSSITATAGTGAGGNITIDPEFIILDHGLISANAAAGAGGNILIQGQYFFDNESLITATGTTAGTVQISTLPLDIVNALAGLEDGFIDLSTSLQESCTMRLGVDASSFLVLGRGGVEDSPGDPQEELAARLRQKAKSKVRNR